MKRKYTAYLVLAPVLIAIIWAARLTSESAAQTMELPCWLFPTGDVVFVPGVDACPLEFLDRVRWVEDPAGDPVYVATARDLRALLRVHSVVPNDSAVVLGIQRSFGETQETVQLVEMSRSSRLGRLIAATFVAGLLMWIPLFSLRRSSAWAAVPLGVFYACVAVVTVVSLAGRQSESLTRFAVLALIVAPAALAHLSLVFPTEGRAAARSPELVRVPYAVSGILALISLTLLDQNPLLWRSFIYLLLASCGAAWMALLASCAFAVRESTAVLERTRAQAVFWGVLTVPVVPAVAITWGSSAPETLAAYLWVSALAMPLPIGLAISRYNLFDLGLDVRHGIAQLVYFGSGAFVSSALIYASLGIIDQAHPLRDMGVLFSASLGCLVVVEGLRRPILGFLEAMLVPRVERLRAVRERYVNEMATLRDEDVAASLLVDVLQQALQARSGCLFVLRGNNWSPVKLFGENPPATISLVAPALAVLGDRPVLHLPRESDQPSDEARILEAQGIEVVAAAGGAGERSGLVLLGPSDSHTPYTGVELEFVAMAVAHAGIAIHNARLAENLVANERHAATARVAVALMHDVGKDLGWIRRLVGHLGRVGPNDGRFKEDVSEVRDLADSVVSRMREFMREATEPRSDPPGVMRLDEMLDSVLRSVALRHGDRRVYQSIDPQLRGLRCHENIGRIVANLVDNGLQASVTDGLVQVSATLEDENWLKISVTDDGCSIDEAVIGRAFEPGFTTRREQGGMGVGLAVSRDIAESMGGTVELARDSTAGTRATVRFPLASLRKRGGAEARADELD